MRKSYYEIVAYFIKKYDLYKKLTEVFKVEFEAKEEKSLDIVYFFNDIYYFSVILDYLKG